MSIYSGFATRQQQESYDQCLQTVLFLLQKRLIRFYKNEVTDEQKFINLLNKIHSQMKSMENHKYLDPKSSKSFQELLIFLKSMQKQAQVASVIPNYQTETEEFTQPELRKDRLPQTKHQPLNEKRDFKTSSQRLQIKFNETNALKEQEIRPNTTSNNRVKKRISVNAQNFNSSYQKAEPDSMKHQSQTEIPMIKERLAVKIIKSSRNEPRKGFVSSQHQIRSNSLNKQKITENLGQNKKQFAPDVQELIKGYMKKTKKSYLRGFHRRKEEIQDMLKCI